MDSSKTIGNFPAVLNFNWPFLELNRFICNQLPILPNHRSHRFLTRRNSHAGRKTGQWMRRGRGRAQPAEWRCDLTRDVIWSHVAMNRPQPYKESRFLCWMDERYARVHDIINALTSRPTGRRAGRWAVSLWLWLQLPGREKGRRQPATLGLPLQASPLDPTILVVILGPNPRSEGTKESNKNKAWQ